MSKVAVVDGVPSASSTCSRLEPDRHQVDLLLVDDIALRQRLARVEVAEHLGRVAAATAREATASSESDAGRTLAR